MGHLTTNEIEKLLSEFKKTDDVEKNAKNVRQSEELLKLSLEHTQVMISDDKLSAYFNIINLKTEKVEKIDETYLLTLLNDKKVKYGILHDEIKRFFLKFKEDMDPLENFRVAKGKPPVKGQSSNFIKAIFSDLDDINYKYTRAVSLSKLLNSTSLDSIEEKCFPVMTVEKGSLLVSTTVPGKGKNGVDIYGNDIVAEEGDMVFQNGLNVKIKVEAGCLNYYSQIFGYLEYEDGVLTVISPVKISKDNLKAYYIGLPEKGRFSRDVNTKEMYDIISAEGIKYGINIKNMKEIVNLRKKKKNCFFKKLIATGKKPEHGTDVKTKLFFGEDHESRKTLEHVKTYCRKSNLFNLVKNKQLIAVKYSLKKGVPGRNIKDEVLSVSNGEDKNFIPSKNIKTVSKKEKTLYYSKVDGRVEVDENSRIRVFEILKIKGDEDINTGNIDHDGDVCIEGTVTPGCRIKASGDIIIDGMVEQNVEIKSLGNIFIKEGLIGKKGNTKVFAKGEISIHHVQEAVVESAKDITIKDYVLNSIIKAKKNFITPDKENSTDGTGLISGGTVHAINGIKANAIGSDMAKITKLVVGVDFDFEKKLNSLNMALEKCEDEIKELSSIIKYNFHDVPKMNNQEVKIPPEKQGAFAEANETMKKLIKSKNKMLSLKVNLFNEIDILSRNAEVWVRDKLLANTHIQIGEAKLRTENVYSNVRLKKRESKKSIIIFKISE
jgi:uncharacterized protein (DUF342 family)